MKIYRISTFGEEYSYQDSDSYSDGGDNYCDIGHSQSVKNPVYLWLMSRDGSITAEKSINQKETHHRVFGNMIDRSICGGRYDINTKVCSIGYFSNIIGTGITSAWVKSLLREKFEVGIDGFYEVGKEYLRASVSKQIRIYKIAQSIIPSEIGSMTIPPDHIRLYHYTRGNPEKVRQEGLKLSHAKGETYGEPNMVWASSIPPDSSSKNIVEFHVAINDQMALEKPSMGQTPEEWMKGNHHVGFYRDIRPEEIIAVHEPWHEFYRYIMGNKDVLDRVLSGDLDNLTEDKYPDEFKAIQAIKSNH